MHAMFHQLHLSGNQLILLHHRQLSSCDLAYRDRSVYSRENFLLPSFILPVYNELPDSHGVPLPFGSTIGSNVVLFTLKLASNVLKT
jgi:hypothetical protein